MNSSILRRFKAAAGIAGTIAGASAVTVGAFAVTTPVKAETTATGASITKEKAKTIALNHAKVTSSQISSYKIETDHEKNGTFYEIEFDYAGYEYEYKINAANGTIVEVDKDPIKGYTKNNTSTANTSKPATNNNTSSTYIGEAKAKTIALNHAKLTADKISAYKIERDTEKGVVYYDVEFNSGNYEYDYDINAITGTIIKYEKELIKKNTVSSYTGLSYRNGTWIYLKKGVQDKKYAGLVYHGSDWWYVKNGKLDKSYIGLTYLNNL